MPTPDDDLTDADDIEPELQRFALTLRQLGDFVNLIVPTEESFRAARLVFGRPFGE